MSRLLAVLAAAVVFFGPSTTLLGVGLLMNPAAVASCLPGGSLTLGPIPDSLTATTRSGDAITLDRTQLTHAGTIITVGAQTAGVARPGAVVALMAALTESSLRMLANTRAYPESADYPNDGNGSDHDSLGLFQMRPASGWGTVAELIDPTYQAKAFYGGPGGPNYPSPRGLLDIPGWQGMDPGEAAQAVEVSAYPDRYQNFQPVAEAILTALTRPAPTSGGGQPVVVETSRVVFPLPSGTWVLTSDFGPRTDPLVDDPTSTGRITARTAHLLTQTRAAFPDTGWACWSPRPGTTSEHPLGRACDVTFGNHIGQAATGASLQAGWAMTTWLQTHADTLGVQYLIWQGKAWTRARAGEGWRPYDGGGMHDPASITGGHYDHLHITVRA